MLALLNQALLERLERAVPAEEWEQLVRAVVTRQTDPYAAADQLAARVGLRPAAEDR